MESTKPRANLPAEQRPIHREERQHAGKRAELGQAEQQQLAFGENDQQERPDRARVLRTLGPDAFLGKLQIDIFDARLRGAIFRGIRRQQLQRFPQACRAPCQSRACPASLACCTSASNSCCWVSVIAVEQIAEADGKAGNQLDSKDRFRREWRCARRKTGKLSRSIAESNFLGAAVSITVAFFISFLNVSFCETISMARSGTNRCTRACLAECRFSDRKSHVGPCAFPPKSYSCSRATLPSLCL